MNIEENKVVVLHLLHLQEVADRLGFRLVFEDRPLEHSPDELQVVIDMGESVEKTFRCFREAIAFLAGVEAARRLASE